MTKNGKNTLSKGDAIQNGEVEFTSLMEKSAQYEKDEETQFIYREEYYAPEGAWGWLIVAAAFCTNFVLDGISLSYSVMTEELTKNKTDGNGTIIGPSMSLTQYNTVGSTLLAVTLMTGPFASAIADKVGFRVAAVCGSLLATIGLIISWAVSPEEPNFWAFLIGVGILTGIGFGIMFTISIVIVGLYFSKNRPLATGITVAGTGVGTLVMAPVMNEILKVGSWQGAMYFQTGLCALSILFGIVYRPVPMKMQKVRKMEENQVLDVPIVQQLAQLLVSPSFLIVALSGSLTMMGYFAPIGFLVDRAAEVIDRDDAVRLLTVFGAGTTIGRLLCGLLANQIGHVLLISNIALTVGGIVTALYPYAESHLLLVVCAACFGLYTAVFATLRSIVIMDIIGKDKFSFGFGLSLIFMGIATLFSNSFGAYLIETTEGYKVSFIVAGAFLIASAVICYPLACIHRWENNKLANPSGLFSSPRKLLVDVQIVN